MGSRRTSWKRGRVVAAGEAPAEGGDPKIRAQASNAPSVPENKSFSEYYKSQNTAFYTPKPAGQGHSDLAGPSANSSCESGPHNTTIYKPGKKAASLDNGQGNGAVVDLQAAPSNSVGNGHHNLPHGSDSITAAMMRAEAALQEAQTALGSEKELKVAGVEAKWQVTFEAAKSILFLGALFVGVTMSHAFGLLSQWGGAVLGAMAVALVGYRKKSLSYTGALAAVFVGCGTIGCSLRFGLTLLAFFFSSSKLTQYKEEVKAQIDDNHKSGGQRDWIQVFCNALVPTLIAIAYGALAGCVDVPLGPSPHLDPLRADIITLLMGAFLGYYACCCGDTWASELGTLSKDTPRLITTLRPVRKGTNGGVSLLGLSASIAGGLFVGLVFYVAGIVSPTLWIFDAQQELALSQWKLIPLGLLAGLFGSLLDSLLGATLQFTGYDPVKEKVVSKPGPGIVHISGMRLLSNNMVNLISASLTSALTAVAALLMFG